MAITTEVHGVSGADFITTPTAGKTYVRLRNPDATAHDGGTDSGTWTVPSGVTAINVLLVGGGGSGGWANISGGGGAGGVVWELNRSVTPAASINVVIGRGEAGQASDTPLKGGTSTFGATNTLTGNGGGGGGIVANGADGGSGGGRGCLGTNGDST